MRYETVMDLHTHTIASGHAYNTLREMAKAAADRGLEILGITELSQSENRSERTLRYSAVSGSRTEYPESTGGSRSE